MKCVLVAVAVLAVCIAELHHGQHDELDALVHRQVHELYETNSLISLEECVKKCDNMFDLTDPIDEQAFDQMCEEHCKCEINHSCSHH
ncbi:hypothetical protein RRG08_053139 [Elysia crispata]|uniref:Uncharacterized protein n=1 Tax=Elysia crispata TaxID=231223 RepID=A0AAE0YT28_9GAST|nr:hypothetical protein RRG08_053139 [Elysia crispata]